MKSTCQTRKCYDPILIRRVVQLMEMGLGHRNMMDLAGNAFNAGTCLKLTLAVLCSVDLRIVLGD
jgi:hypothetical protein